MIDARQLSEGQVLSRESVSYARPKSDVGSSVDRHSKSKAGSATEVNHQANVEHAVVVVSALLRSRGSPSVLSIRPRANVSSQPILQLRKQRGYRVGRLHSGPGEDEDRE